MVQSKARRAIDQQVKHCREWNQNIGPGVLEYSHDLVERHLLEGELRSFRGISSGLGGLATYWGSRGTVALLDGDCSSWKDIHYSCELLAWRLRIEVVLFRKLADHPRLTHFIPSMACALCYAIACRLDSLQAEFTHFLVELTNQSDALRKDYWNEREFEPFVLQLHQHVEGKFRPVKRHGVYSSILDHWDDPQALSTCLFDACDYHCLNMRERKGDRDPEFCEPPFDLIPWEILAIFEVLRRTGRDVVQVNHPLVLNRVMNPEPPALDRGPLLNRVLVALSEFGLP